MVLQTFTPKSTAFRTQDALAQLLSQATEQKARENAMAPIQSAAYEFSDRILGQTASGLGKAVRASTAMTPAAPLGNLISQLTAQKPQPKANQKAEAEGSGAAKFLGEQMRFTVPGAVMGLANKYGTLSPEESIVEADQRLAKEAAGLTRVEKKADIRRQLRDLTPERAAALGLPTAPGAKPEDAEAAAAADENLIRSARERKDYAALAVAGKVAKPSQTWWLNAIQTASRTGISTITGAMKAPLEVMELQLGLALNGGEAERSAARAYLDGIDKAVTDMLPGDKARSKDFITEVAAGGGSMSAFLLAGAAAAAIGAPVAGTIGVVGGASMANEMFEDAENHGATLFQKYTALAVGAALGATEMVPIENMLWRADRATGGRVMRLLKNTTAGSLEEFMQEFGQNVGSDVAAKVIYDPDRDIDLAASARTAAAAAIAGGATAAGTTLMNGRPSSPFEGLNEVELQRIGDEMFKAAQVQFDQTLDEDLDQDTLDELDVAANVDVATLSTTGDQATGAITEVVAPVPLSEPDPAVAAADPVRGQIDKNVARLLEPTEEEAQKAERSKEFFQGGTPPKMRDDGLVELTHWSDQPLTTLDPAVADTRRKRSSPERQRAFGPQWVPRVYYGLEATNTRDKKMPYDQQRRAGYVNEGLFGPVRHTAAVDPNTIYNYYEDPMGLRAQLDRSKPASEIVTDYEKLIADAGFSGYWIDDSDLGQVVAMYTPTQPESVFNQATGEVTIDSPNRVATRADFEKLTPETLDRGGWAVLTNVEEAKGPFNSPENQKSYRKMKAELKGEDYIEITGTYQGVDQGPSFIVFGPESRALAIAKRYGQESILTRNGLEYSDGRRVPVNRANTVVGDAARAGDFYSTLPNGASFSVGLDFEAGEMEAMFDAQVAPGQIVDPLEGTGDWRNAEITATTEDGSEVRVNAGDAVDLLLQRITAATELMSCINAN